MSHPVTKFSRYTTTLWWVILLRNSLEPIFPSDESSGYERLHCKTQSDEHTLFNCYKECEKYEQKNGSLKSTSSILSKQLLWSSHTQLNGERSGFLPWWPTCKIAFDNTRSRSSGYRMKISSCSCLFTSSKAHAMRGPCCSKGTFGRMITLHSPLMSP